MAGWQIDVTGSPIEQISMRLNGIPCGNATLSRKRADVRDHFDRDDYLFSGWQFSLDHAFAQKYILGTEERLLVEVMAKNRDHQYGFVKVFLGKEMMRE